MVGFEPGIFRPLFRVRTKAPPVAGSWRRICWQLRAVPRGQSGRKALWARARARARSPYNHGTHPLTKSAERRVSAAPRTMQARLVSRRCASARRWLPAGRCARGAALARARRHSRAPPSVLCAAVCTRWAWTAGSGALHTYMYAYMRRWQGSWERGRFEICRSKKRGYLALRVLSALWRSCSQIGV